MAISVTESSGNTISVTVSGGTSTTFSTTSTSVSVTPPTQSTIDVKAQGPKGDKGDTGPTGATGPAGADGADGQGVPTGGSQFQILRKVSGTDYDTDWDYADRVNIEVRFDEAVSKGDPLYITGFNNGQNRITVAKADASDSAKMPSIGLAFDDYSQNDNGQATSIGSLDDVNTQQAPNDFQEGDVLYVKAGGGLTNVKPTGTNLIQNVGKVGRRQQNNGQIVVMAIGRSNDVPNIPEGQAWIGNASGVATPTTLADVATSGAYSDLSGTPTIPSGDLVDDTTPQLGGNLDVNGYAITSASNGNITIDPDGTGAIIMKSDDIQFDGGGTFSGKVKLYESDILGSNFLALSAPINVTSDTTLYFPDGVGSNGQALTTDGSLGNLSWSSFVTSSNPTVSGVLSIEEGGADTGRIALYDIDGSNYVLVKAPSAIGSNFTLTLPVDAGSSGQVLRTDGSGNLSWVTTSADPYLGPWVTSSGRFQFDIADVNKTIACGSPYGPIGYYLWYQAMFNTVSSGTVDTTTQLLSSVYQNYGGLRMPDTKKVSVDLMVRNANATTYSKNMRLQVWSFSLESSSSGVTMTLRADQTFTTPGNTYPANVSVTTTSAISADDYIMVFVAADNITLSGTGYIYATMQLELTS